MITSHCMNWSNFDLALLCMIRSAYSLKYRLQNAFYRLNTDLILTKIQSIYSLKTQKYRLL